jgi:hypothetical protein
MDRDERELLYLVSQDDAYRIEGLISTLAMAVWEILEQGKMTPTPPLDDIDAATIAEDTFLSETRRILKPSDSGL